MWTSLGSASWTVPLIWTGRDDPEPSLNKANAVLSVTPDTLQWIWRHPELHSCHFPARQPSGRPAISHSKRKLLRLAERNFHFQRRAQALRAPALLCSLSQQTFLSPKDEREAAHSAYSFRANESRWYSGIPCIMKVLNKAGKYHFCLSVALPSRHSLQHVSPSR